MIYLLLARDTAKKSMTFQRVKEKRVLQGTQAFELCFWSFVETECMRKINRIIENNLFPIITDLAYVGIYRIR